MTTETQHDLPMERTKGIKRSVRPKFLKLTDVTIPRRIRKKTKIKSKEGPQSSSRDRMYEDPAYTDDISHLANPLRRSSCSGKPLSKSKDGSGSSALSQMESNSLGRQSKFSKEFFKIAPTTEFQMAKANSLHRGASAITYDSTSSGSDNEGNNATDKTKVKIKKVNSEKKSSNKSDYTKRRQTDISPSFTTSQLDEMQSASVQESSNKLPQREPTTKLQIGRRLLRGEIGLKSFNYYLIKEGLKTSKKCPDKSVNAENLRTRSEENIYEEIFFKDTSSCFNMTTESVIDLPTIARKEKIHNQSKLTSMQKSQILDTRHSQCNEVSDELNCQLCIQQCENKNCAYCLAEAMHESQSAQVKEYSTSKNAVPHRNKKTAHHRDQNSESFITKREDIALPVSHILEFQSYNPNNPGVFKMETTPVAITGEYNPILQFQQQSAIPASSTTLTFNPQNYSKYYQGQMPQTNQAKSQYTAYGSPMSDIHYRTGQFPLQVDYIVAPQNGILSDVAGNAIILQRSSTKSSSSSDSFKYQKYNAMAPLDPMNNYLYSIGKPTQLHPLLCSKSRPIGGSQTLIDPYEVPRMYKSDSHASVLSEFSLRSSDECRNCDCSSHLSSDFDDMCSTLPHNRSTGIPRKTAAGTLPGNPPQNNNLKSNLHSHHNKYAHDFFKHVNDVKRSIYQSEMQRNNSLESTRRNHRTGIKASRINNELPVSQEPGPVVSTLPLTKARTVALNPTATIPRHQDPVEPSESPKSSGTVPKNHLLVDNLKHLNTVESTKSSLKVVDTSSSSKRHQRSNSNKTQAASYTGIYETRRKDIPAPPPPSPATYSDLQELKANMECLQDDTKPRSLESESSEIPQKIDKSSKSVPEKIEIIQEKSKENLSKNVSEDITNCEKSCIPIEQPLETTKLALFEDDDVFYDAQSENSAGGLITVMDEQNKDVQQLKALSNKKVKKAEEPDTLKSSKNLNQFSDSYQPKSSIDSNFVNIEHSKKVNKSENNTSTIPAALLNSSCDDLCSQSEPEATVKLNNDTNKTNTQSASTHNVAATNEEKHQRTPRETHVPSNGATLTNVKANSGSDITALDGPTSSPPPPPPVSNESENASNASFAQSGLSASTPNKIQPIFLARQSNASLDSSESQSEDSHITRDSATRGCDNDELSSSTLDKIDVSSLPLPAIPVKRKRTRIRTSPSKHLLNQQYPLYENRGNNANDLITKQQIRRTKHRESQKQQSKADINVDSHRAGVQTAPQLPHKQHSPTYKQYIAKRRESLEASTHTFNEKIEARGMHYYMGIGACGSSEAATKRLPTYIFGDKYSNTSRKSVVPVTNNEEIYLNKSGWVQVNHKRDIEDASYDGSYLPNTVQKVQSRQSNFTRQSNSMNQRNFADSSTSFKLVTSSADKRLQTNDSRSSRSFRDPIQRFRYRSAEQILNERPGFLPVKKINDLESPPPITPILSPPPAFQDKRRYNRLGHRRKPNHQIPLNSQKVSSQGNEVSSKGMVFSRSFEYDTRRQSPYDSYVETFSRSFDGNLSEKAPLPLLPVQRDRFSTLTGNSPNYLSKTDSCENQDNSPKSQLPQTTAYLNAAVKEAPPICGNSNTFQPTVKYSSSDRCFQRSKNNKIATSLQKSQFSEANTPAPTSSKNTSRFRSGDVSISQRLNSCDSGARSDLSNDELEEDNNATAIDFLSTHNFEHSNKFINSANNSPLRTQRQRSLTPDCSDSHRRSPSSLHKQRSQTPDLCLQAPEDQIRKDSQLSRANRRLNSPTNRTNQQNSDDKSIMQRKSHSSSSSSYSGGDRYEVQKMVVSSTVNATAAPNSHIRSSTRRADNQSEQEFRERRSRSLQLSDRSSKKPMRIIDSEQSSKMSGSNPKQGHRSSKLLSSSKNGIGSNKEEGNNIDIGKVNSTRHQKNEVDKSRSFDYEYKNCYRSGFGLSQEAISRCHTSDNNSNANIRLNYDKSRSFDDDYREKMMRNANSLRYQQNDRDLVTPTSSDNHPNTSPITPRSPQSSSSSTNNLHVSKHKQTNSPKNYGTRLRDHELTCDTHRQSLDRSPIINFRRGEHNESLRNRETINSGGNSELHFMSNEMRTYEHPTTVLKQHRPLRHSPVPNDDFTLKVSIGVGGDYLYQQVASSQHTTSRTSGMNLSTNTKSYPDYEFTCKMKNTSEKLEMPYSDSRDIIKENNCDAQQRRLNLSPKLLNTVPGQLQQERRYVSRAIINTAINDVATSDETNFFELHTTEKLPQSTDVVNITDTSLISVVPSKLLEDSVPKTTIIWKEESAKPKKSEILRLTEDAVLTKTKGLPICTESSPDIANNLYSKKKYDEDRCGITSTCTTTLWNDKDSNILQSNQLPATHSKLDTIRQKPSATITIVPVTSDSENESNDGNIKLVEYRYHPQCQLKSHLNQKDNRQDKCHSGDSGIHIDAFLENQPTKTEDTKHTATPQTHDFEQGRSKTLLVNGPLDRHRKIYDPLLPRSLSEPNGLDILRSSLSELKFSSNSSELGQDGVYYPIYAEVLYNFCAADHQELSLKQGSFIEILRRGEGPWWFGRLNEEGIPVSDPAQKSKFGWFPKDFVQIIPSMANDDCLLKSVVKVVPESKTENKILMEKTDATVRADNTNVTTIVIESPSRENSPLIQSSNDKDNLQSAIRELLETEINYVKLLTAICDGYLMAMRNRFDIFPPHSIRLIFSNIENIYQFQCDFLKALRIGVEQNQVAKVFLKMYKGFLCYSVYCNTYPRAVLELESYDQIKDAQIFLESCRGIENIAELPLAAHLLAPVQRICRYPLHLNEIIKASTSDKPCTVYNRKKLDISNYEKLDITELDIADSQYTLSLALEAMRSITEAVNERKRHSETIAHLQASFLNFKGSPLQFHSTRFFLQTEVTLRKQNVWNNRLILFLFDHQLIYCKRDLIKRNHFTYKGRIFLDRCRFVNLRDGKWFGNTLKNSLRIYCTSHYKWYDFTFRSSNRKQHFLNALALERQFLGKELYVDELKESEFKCEEHGDECSDCQDDEQHDDKYGLISTFASSDCCELESYSKKHHYSDTIPKLERSKNDSNTNATQDKIHSSASTGSLKRLGLWFRKSKGDECMSSLSPMYT